MAHVTRITDTVSGKQPLKFHTGAEVAKSVVVDNDAITADTYGRKLVVKGELLTKITATGLYGPYSRTAVDGRATIALGTAVIANEDADVQLGDKAIGGYYHNCVFDASECTLHKIAGHADPLATLRTAFPTCTWDD